MRKKTIFTWIVAISALLLTTQPASAVPSVRLDVLIDNIMVGDSFDVEVWVSSDGTYGDLTGFGFDFFWPDSLLSSEGFLDGEGFDEFLLEPPNITGFWDPSLSQDQNLLLATLSFEALNVGTGSLSVLGTYDSLFYGLFYLKKGFNIYASTSITVNPVPEPATLVLLAAGMGGLGFVKGRRVTARRTKGCA